MQLLSEIVISRRTGTGPVSGPYKNDKTDGAVIQLLQGDITAIPKEHRVDIIVVSAFPGDYTPLHGSLMCALHEKGIEVGELAKDKAVDLVQQLGCWLSNPLSRSQQEQFNFKQILCFEPSRESGAPETVVSNIFRCINNFVFDDSNNVIAMPVLASGRQKVPVEKMLPAMLDACIFWMDSGIPLHAIKLIIHSDAHAAAALPIFERARQEYESRQAAGNALSRGIGSGQEVTGPPFAPAPALPAAPPSAPASFVLPPTPADRGKTHGTTATQPPSGRGKIPATKKPSAAPSPAPTAPPPAPVSAPVAGPSPPAGGDSGNYDFFISYSHVQTPQVAELVKALKEKDSSLNIFYDRSSIPAGGMWIRQISDAIQRSKSVVCVLSPEYRNSDACWDEFQCAKVKEFRTKKPVIKTINFMTDADMPLIMAVYSYIDCTEGDVNKLRAAVGDLF